MSEVSEILANELLKELKLKKRWNRIFKLLFFIWLFAVIWIVNSNKNSTDVDEDHTAIIDINGMIAENTENNLNYISKSMEKAFANPKAKGIIIKINSPGGTPVTADEIYNEINRMRASNPDKKVYAVCTDVCASAAYYIAAAADEIYANPASFVGSISVLYNGFGFNKIMETVGIDRRLIASGKFKGFLDPFSPLNEEEVVRLKSMLQSLHNLFIQDVQAGRKGKLSDDPELYTGLYWTGEKAKQLGLIDGFGSPNSVARDVIKAKTIIKYTNHNNYFEKIADKVNFGYHAIIDLLQMLK